ncbi:MAG: hypothetical protein ACRDGQ_09660, partial [Candidatus Limnocylindrales bacterium]
MTLLFVDSFDHYTTVPGDKGWVTPPNSSGNGSIGAFGRNGTNGFQCGNSRKGDIQVVPSAPATITVGVAVNVAGLADAQILLSLWDGSTEQILLQAMALGSLQALRSSNAILGTTPPGVLQPGHWTYIELQSKIDPAAGTVVVKVNGTTVLNLAGINTRQSATSEVNGVGLCGMNEGSDAGVVNFDDLYIADTLGAINNGFLGDVRIVALLPNGAGNYTEWDGLTGAATHWQAVSENPPNDDTSYVSDTLAIPGHRDTYTLADLPAAIAGTVPAVQAIAYARKDDAGVRTIATMVRSAAADATGADVNLG